MWPDNTLTEHFGIQHPIILAPMAGATSAESVAAVSNAGGLGSYGAASANPDVLREVIRGIRQLTGRPFHVNLFSEPSVLPGDPGVAQAGTRETLRAFHDELELGELPDAEMSFESVPVQLEVLLQEKVPVISFHFGVVDDMLQMAKSGGATVMCSATTVAEAVLLEQAGVDVIIAQGAEAGGHRGTFTGEDHLPLIGTLALVPQVVDAVSVPVIAAGGIMDGRGIVAALALGASAVQMGTAFLGCAEAPVPPAWKKSLHRADATQSEITRAISGRPARGIRNRLMSALEATGEPPLSFPAQYSISREVRSAARSLDEADFMALWAGQGVGLVREFDTQEFMSTLVGEYRVCLQKLAG